MQMKRYLWPWLVCTAWGCHDAPEFLGPSSQLSAVSGGAGNPLRVIVTLREGTSPGMVARAHGLMPRFIYLRVLNGFAVELPVPAQASLLRDSRVVRVEPDVALMTASATPWSLDRIDQRALPLDGAYSVAHNGAGVTAYIVDTGVRYDHQEFGGRAGFGYDAFGGNGADCHGHGTHVAGTLGGASYGVAPGVRLVAVRVLDCAGSGSVSSVVAGLDWIAGQNARPAVANMSLTGTYSGSLNDAVARLVSAGVSVAVAAGNSNADACYASPASAPVAITVGAADSGDRRAGFSNWGDCLDVFAPGVSVASAYHTSATATASMSGTSMAAPHTAGVAALLLDAAPTLTPGMLRDSLVLYATKDIVADALSTYDLLLYARREAHGELPPPPPPPGPPVAPADLTVTPYAGQPMLYVNWYDANRDTDYAEVQRQVQGATIWVTVAELPRGTSSFTDAGLNPSTTYRYRARISTAGGISEWSNEATGTTCAARGGSGKCR